MTQQTEKYGDLFGPTKRMIVHHPLPKSLDMTSPTGDIGLLVLDHITGEVAQETKGNIGNVVSDANEWGKLLRKFGLSRRQVGKTNIHFQDNEYIPGGISEVIGGHDRKSFFHPRHENQITLDLRNAASALEDGGGLNEFNKDLHNKTIDELIAYGHGKNHQRMRKIFSRMLLVSYPGAVVGRLAFDNVIGKDIPEVGLGALIKNATGIDVFAINTHLTDILHLIQQIPFIAKDLRTLVVAGAGALTAFGVRFLMNKSHERRYEKFKAEQETKHAFDPEALPLAVLERV
ncbi:MAG TPA: hypothetical protein VF189_05205 [Patescibacteria group bacterium]